MKKFKFLPFVLFLLLSNCKNEDVVEPQSAGRFCTLIGAISSLQVDFYKAPTLMSYLAYSINDGDILYDDCEGENTGTLKDNRFYFTAVIGEGETFSSYFKNGRYRDTFPVSNIINFKLYHRDSCELESELALNKTTQIDWTPLYPNGETCGLDGHEGQVEIIGD